MKLNILKIILQEVWRFGSKKSCFFYSRGMWIAPKDFFVHTWHACVILVETNYHHRQLWTISCRKTTNGRRMSRISHSCLSSPKTHIFHYEGFWMSSRRSSFGPSLANYDDGDAAEWQNPMLSQFSSISLVIVCNLETTGIQNRWMQSAVPIPHLLLWIVRWKVWRLTINSGTTTTRTVLVSSCSSPIASHCRDALESWTYTYLLVEVEEATGFW